MHSRRRFLAGVTASILTLTGCGSEDSTSEESPRRTATSGPSMNSETDSATASPSPTPTYLNLYRRQLSQYSFTVVLLQSRDTTVELGYVTEAREYEALARQVGQASGAFFNQVQNGWDATQLESTVLDQSETPSATWFAEAAWFQQYQNGDLSAEQLSLKVLETFSRVES